MKKIVQSQKSAAAWECMLHVFEVMLAITMSIPAALLMLVAISTLFNPSNVNNIGAGFLLVLVFPLMFASAFVAPVCIITMLVFICRYKKSYLTVLSQKMLLLSVAYLLLFGMSFVSNNLVLGVSSALLVVVLGMWAISKRSATIVSK